MSVRRSHGTCPLMRGKQLVGQSPAIGHKGETTYLAPMREVTIDELAQCSNVVPEEFRELFPKFGTDGRTFFTPPEQALGLSHDDAVAFPSPLPSPSEWFGEKRRRPV